MQPAHSGNPNNLRSWRRALDDGPTQRRVLRQGIVSAIFMVVPEVFGQEPSCVPFVEDKLVIHHVSATAFAPAARDSILPGLRNSVRTGVMFMFLADTSTWRSKVESRSKRRYLGAEPWG